MHLPSDTRDEARDDVVNGASRASMSNPAAAPSGGRLAVSIGQYSGAGRKPANQDFHGALVPEGSALALKGITLAVADGISSSPISRDAAETAVKSLMSDYYCTSGAWTVKTAASRVIAATNAWLYNQNRAARLGDMDRGQVCTLAALILKGREAHLFHVGDSRIYRVAGRSLEPLTEDHTLTLSESETYLGRAMGAAGDVEVDYRALPLREGDTFLLTTDGIHDHLKAGDMAALLNGAPDLDSAAHRIAEAALANGSDDNLTVQIVRIDALPDVSGAEILGDAVGLPVPPLPRAGDEIDGFRIIRPLRESSRSHIYLAAAPDSRRVALKIPSMDLREDPDYLRRFVLEEWIARRLSSTHVVRAAEPPERRTALYVVTEYVDGRTLRQWMTDHPHPSLDEVRDIVEQIARGLRAFHRCEMLHQDLRPENVMIDGEGTVKIIDFGSASVAGVEERAPGLAGQMPGTFQFTAPEYLSGDAVSWRSDLYSLGVIAYEMLTGKLPYGAQVARIRSRADQRRLRYRPAGDDDHPVPEWIDDALRRAVHPDPLRRHDALSEFVADLRRPPAGYRPRRHVPLAERDPVRFWQGVSALLGLVVIYLLASA